jgi:hypothetical protein
MSVCIANPDVRVAFMELLALPKSQHRQHAVAFMVVFDRLTKTVPDRSEWQGALSAAELVPTVLHYQLGRCVRRGCVPCSVAPR